MRKTVADEIQKETNSKIAEMQTEMSQVVSRLEKEKDSAAAEAERMDKEMTKRQGLDRTTFVSWANRALKYERRMKFYQKWTIVALTIIAFAVGL